MWQRRARFVSMWVLSVFVDLLIRHGLVHTAKRFYFMAQGALRDPGLWSGTPLA
jgi:hypothetical protein